MASPIASTVVEAKALPPLPFSALFSPPDAVLSTNSRPFAVHLSVKSDRAKTFKLLEQDGLKRQLAGFLSAKVVGPLEVSLVGIFAASPTVVMGHVVVALHDSAWTVDSVEKAQQVPDSLVLALGQMSPAVTGRLPFPPTFRNNVGVTMVAGLEPSVTVCASLLGYSSVSVVVRGLVELEGMVPLQPWA